MKTYKFLSIVLVTLLSINSFAATVSESNAKNAVKGWQALNSNPLGANLNKPIKVIQEFKNQSDELLYYLVKLEPKGFVIVAPDNQIEPIIAFSGTGYLDTNSRNPLYDFLNADMESRLEFLKSNLSIVSTKNNQTKWQNLLAAADKSSPLADASLPTIDDPRIDPLVSSKWNQLDASGNACYNYYTPRYVGSTVTWEDGNAHKLLLRLCCHSPISISQTAGISFCRNRYRF